MTPLKTELLSNSSKIFLLCQTCSLGYRSYSPHDASYLTVKAKLLYLSVLML